MKLALKVIPNAKKSEAAGWEDDPRAGRVLRLRIAAPPVEGKRTGPSSCSCPPGWTFPGPPSACCAESQPG